jgi:hypothetical protein
MTFRDRYSHEDLVDVTRIDVLIQRHILLFYANQDKPRANIIRQNSHNDSEEIRRYARIIWDFRRSQLNDGIDALYIC